MPLFSRHKKALPTKNSNHLIRLLERAHQGNENMALFCLAHASDPLVNKTLSSNNALKMLKGGKNLKSICRQPPLPPDRAPPPNRSANKQRNGNGRANGTGTVNRGNVSNSTANTGSKRFNKPATNNSYRVLVSRKRLVGPNFIDPKMPHRYGAYSGRKNMSW